MPKKEITLISWKIRVLSLRKIRHGIESLFADGSRMSILSSIGAMTIIVTKQEE